MKGYQSPVGSMRLSEINVTAREYNCSVLTMVTPNEMGQPMQVEDDIALLEMMMADHASASPDYAATARWAEYSSKFVEFLRSKGLKDFRSLRLSSKDPGRILRSFGASDLNPDGIEPEAMFQLAASMFIKNGAKNIRELLPSRVGNPEGFEIEGKFYTASWLNYFIRYAYVTKFIRLNSQTIVEVGPGSGKQAEMLKKAHPELTILLFDLPTQLYVCNQYLTKVFEDSDQVIPYRQAKLIERYEDIPLGKIVILPHWKFPMLSGKRFDLLWNAASFQEMDPVSALPYLHAASAAKAMYLMHNIKYRLNATPGSRGVITEHHIKSHIEVDRVQAKHVQPTLQPQYFDSYWRHRDDS